MSALSPPHESWLQLKHCTKPRQYGLYCGDRDLDWDFADPIMAGPDYGYSFASESTPVQLLNNSGGMDEDDEPIKDVWYPDQHRSTEDADSDMSDMVSSTSDDMDVDMDLSDPANPPQAQPQLQQPQVNKKKRNADSMTFEPQQLPFNYTSPQQQFVDTTKRIRVGA